MLLKSVLDAVGHTPLVPLKRIGEGLACNLYGKCEFLNPGGSLKDRIAVRMIEEAEKAGTIKPGDTLIEATSGNTGIGMALAGAVKGYHVIITMPEKMSHEKQVVLEALGAKIIRTPTEASYDSPESHISVAKRLQEELPNAFILNQYTNPENPNAHYFATGQEILDDLNGKIDMVVIGAGTGGTITGIARRIKEHNPKCLIVGVDPIGSILGGGTTVASYKVEGIGYDFVPDVLDRKLVDIWVKSNDRQSFILARKLIREEGLLCGGSSGATLFGALKEAGRLKKGDNCVVILADGVRNYLSKFVDDKWMRDNRFTSYEALAGSVGEFTTEAKDQKLKCIKASEPVQNAVSIMRDNGFSQLPIVADSNGNLLGMLYEKDILEYMLSTHQPSRNLKVKDLMSRNSATVTFNTPVAVLQEFLISSDCVVVIDENRIPKRVVTKIDLVEYLASMERKA